LTKFAGYSILMLACGIAFCVDDFLFRKTFIYLKYLLKVKLSLFRLISQALLCNFWIDRHQVFVRLIAFGRVFRRVMMQLKIAIYIAIFSVVVLLCLTFNCH